MISFTYSVPTSAYLDFPGSVGNGQTANTVVFAASGLQPGLSFVLTIQTEIATSTLGTVTADSSGKVAATSFDVTEPSAQARLAMLGPGGGQWPNAGLGFALAGAADPNGRFIQLKAQAQ